MGVILGTKADTQDSLKWMKGYGRRKSIVVEYLTEYPAFSISPIILNNLRQDE
jgi:hypothetical protein